MITNTGKEIIGKYLVGQTDSYASYLAIGSGEKPIGPSGSLGNYAERTSLTFETLRVPIISRSLITESGVTRVFLTAELPTEERYEITEVGIYPAESNPIPTGLDSQALILFDATELWEEHQEGETAVAVPLELGTIANEENDVTVTGKIFYTNSNNSLFEKTNYPDRVERHERPRFLDRTIFLRGDSSELAVDNSDLSVTSGDHIHLATGPIDLTRNSTEDELRFAFSVVNKNGTEIGQTPEVPSNVKILVQFASTDGANPEYASFVVNLDKAPIINTQTPTGTTNITITTAANHNISVGDEVIISGIVPLAYNGEWTAQTGTTGSTLVVNIGSNPGAITDAGVVANKNQYDFVTNRYVVVSKPIKDLYTTEGFSWDTVTTIKAYVCVNNNSTGAGNFYVALDALKLENVSSFNNIYGLTAYTIMKTSDSLPIIKSDNTSNFIEFSYLVDVS
jgi:hypothetical protein